MLLSIYSCTLILSLFFFCQLKQLENLCSPALCNLTVEFCFIKSNVPGELFSGVFFIKRVVGLSVVGGRWKMNGDRSLHGLDLKVKRN